MHRLASQEPRLRQIATHQSNGIVSAAAEEQKYGFLKGNTHIHTNGSDDSETPVADAARWYEERGFDFVVVTDHNRVTVLRHNGKILVIPGVEMTKNVYLPEGPGRKYDAFAIHMNGYFISEDRKGLVNDPPAKERTRVAMYEAEFDAIQKLGGVPCLNHPNFWYSADAVILSRLANKGLKFFEVYNSADKSKNDGEPGRQSTEQLWDSVLSTGTMLFGIVSDDTHHYYDAAKVASPRIGNLAWSMVRADEKTPASIKAALIKGDFYGSTGVTLKRLEITDKAMEIEVAPQAGRTYTIRFVGKNGKVLVEQSTTSARYEFKGDELYVRAVVVDSSQKKAWIQPKFIKP